VRRLNLILGTTNSQPVGTPDHHTEAVYQSAYKPFLRLLYHERGVPLTLHYSGTLLSWLAEHHSEFIDVLAEMVGRKQVELLGGTFYDAVMSHIPRTDQLGQIENLTTYLRKLFGRRPRGAWVTEQVWEPFMASTLKNSGIEYVFLDDLHFAAAGVSAGRARFPCITEDQGKTLVVFPIQRDLESILHRESPAGVLDVLSEYATDEPGAVVGMIFSGEQFGTREESFDRFYEQSWLQKFTKLLRENQDWLTVTTPWRYLRAQTPRGRVYFPTGTSNEVLLGCLPEKQRKHLHSDQSPAAGEPGGNGYVHCGFFRQLLTRYPESNLMYAKMQYTHVLVNQIRGDKYRKRAAREELWKGQCHIGYWHGRTGGIYRNGLRKAIYSSLIEAEKVTRERGIFSPSVITVDFDMDGLNEYLYQGQEINVYVHLEGGMVIELDYLPRPWNYADVMARRPAVYQSQESANSEADRYIRRAFIDHVLDPDDDIERFHRMEHWERAPFVEARYQVVEYDREGHELELSAVGYVETSAGNRSLRLTKRYRFERSQLHVLYRLETADSDAWDSGAWDDEGVPLLFAPELNLSFSSPDAGDLRIHAEGRQGLEEIAPLSTRSVRAAEGVQLEDIVNRTHVTLAGSQAFDLWSLPIVTAAYADGAVVEEYQGSCLLPRFDVLVGPARPAEISLTLAFGPL